MSPTNLPGTPRAAPSVSQALNNPGGDAGGLRNPQHCREGCPGDPQPLQGGSGSSDSSREDSGAGFVTALSLQSQALGLCGTDRCREPSGLSSEEELQMSQLSESTWDCSCRASRDVGCWCSPPFAPEAPRESRFGEISKCGKV